MRLVAILIDRFAVSGGPAKRIDRKKEFFYEKHDHF